MQVKVLLSEAERDPPCVGRTQSLRGKREGCERKRVKGRKNEGVLIIESINEREGKKEEGGRRREKGGDREERGRGKRRGRGEIQTYLMKRER